MKTYTAQKFEVAFYEAMVKWVSEGKAGPDPRGEWEVDSTNGLNWIPSCGIPAFLSNQYRWKPTKKRTVVIDSVELVAPEVDAPEQGRVFFISDSYGTAIETHWTSTAADNIWLANGKVFLTREDAQAMADAQRKQRMGGATDGRCNMTKHTPGPWKWDGDVWNYNKKEEAPWLIDTIGSHVPILGGTIRCAKEADARLIAAAPELLETLHVIVDAFDSLPPTHEARYAHLKINTARAAIAKATGEVK
jgi:hypothetical protein